ncbi:MAG: hypothetical protein ACQET5_11675 [Halobacteriota archaeon]|uniref:hypothetical protein n=1 Tax=Natronomonas sp. TaxID=2184060 RepID=UPI003975DED2
MAAETWESIATAEASISVETTAVVTADEGRPRGVSERLPERDRTRWGGSRGHGR